LTEKWFTWSYSRKGKCFNYSCCNWCWGLFLLSGKNSRFVLFSWWCPKGKPISETAPHHTPWFYIDESGFLLGMKVLSNLTIDYMEMQSKVTTSNFRTIDIKKKIVTSPVRAQSWTKSQCRLMIHQGQQKLVLNILITRVKLFDNMVLSIGTFEPYFCHLPFS
jgi:hypothetical protein